MGPSPNNSFLSGTKWLFGSVILLFKFLGYGCGSVESLPSMHNIKPDMVEQTCNPNTMKVEAGGSDVQSRIASEKASLDYRRQSFVHASVCP